MKASFLVLTVILFACLSSPIQGAHLSSGDSVDVGFDGFGGIDACTFTEFVAGSRVRFYLGADLLDMGETLKLEMFENNASEPPIAMGIFSPSSASFISATLLGPYSWADGQGTVRATMMSGSVDITTAEFTAAPNRDTYCGPISVVVPEPNFAELMLLGATAGALFWVHRGKAHWV